jgi:predicted kinase
MMEQILDNDGNVVLDLGFTTKAQRSTFVERAKRLGVAAEVHYLEAPTTLRRKRVERRNREKDPRVFSFEVTRQMFDFMEPRFERPSAEEMQNGKRIEIVESPD